MDDALHINKILIITKAIKQIIIALLIIDANKRFIKEFN